MYKLYGLKERKENSDFKYFGITKQHLFQRLGQHLSKMIERGTRRDEWLMTLKDVPEIILIKEFKTRTEAELEERNIITEYEISGKILFNEAKNYNRRFKIELKKVYQYDSSGEFLTEYNSASEAQAISNGFLNYKCINACCNGTKKSHKGFFFSFKKLKNYSTTRTIRKNTKAVYQFDLNGNLINKFESPYLAKDFLAGEIWKCCNNFKNIKTHRGFIWSYNSICDKV